MGSKLSGACPNCGEQTLETQEYDYPLPNAICTKALCENCGKMIGETYELTFQEILEDE